MFPFQSVKIKTTRDFKIKIKTQDLDVEKKEWRSFSVP